jgi:hypothetical protein
MEEFETCEKCKYRENTENEYPCNRCVHGCVVKEYYEPMTNADKIRDSNDEELAEFLCKVKSDYQLSDHEFPSEEEYGEWVEWLQSEVEE